MKTPYLLLSGLLFVASSHAQTVPTYTITTVAGNGVASFAGDGGPGTSASLNTPQDLAIAEDGSVYISDCFNQRIRKLSPDGTISTIAGTGTAGYSGDGGSAASATFKDPCGIAIDKSGAIYISDSDNHAIRKVSGSNVTTLAGNGLSGFSGDDAAAKDAILNVPLGLVLDSSGNLYFADALNHRIRKIATDGKISSVVGGAPGYFGDGGAALDARLNGPRDVALDSAGNLYIADTFNHRIRKVATDGTVTTVAGGAGRGFSGDGGQAVDATLNYPQGVAVDASGNIYIADTANNRIRMVTENGTIATIGGSGTFGDSGDNGPAKRARLRFPSGIAVDGSGNVWITDDQNSRVRKLTRDPAPADSNPSVERVTISSAFGGATEIAPGAWVEIYGSNLSITKREWTATDFDGADAPTSLDGIEVTIGGAPAYVAYVSPKQVNVLVPSNASLGEQDVVVTRGDLRSQPFKVKVNGTQPGLLAEASMQAGGKNYATAMVAGGTVFVHPSADLGRPARPGETITLYGTGFGPVTPYSVAGKIVNQRTAVDLPLKFYFGDTEAVVAGAGLVAGTTGLYEFQIVVPNVPSNDAVPLTYTLDSVKGTQTLYTAVRD